MKKAFTLLELTLSCVIFTLLLVLVSKSLKESHHLNQKTLETHQIFLDLNAALLSVEKIFSKCLKVQLSSNALTCLLRDDENILDLDDENKAYIINSGLILENNTSLYSPKSQFLKLLQNRKALFNDDEQKLYVLAQDEVKILQILDDEKVKTDFSGVFLPLEARLDLSLKNGEILYELKPKFQSDLLGQSAVLAHNVSVFEIQQKNKTFILKICMQKEDLNQCLQKRLYQ